MGLQMHDGFLRDTGMYFIGLQTVLFVRKLSHLADQHTHANIAGKQWTETVQ